MTPTVSIIIPTYNEAKSIQRCLDAIYAQTLLDRSIEIIIADGGSDDGTTTIIKKNMKNHRNIVLLANPTRNTADGRNLCVRHAKGDYLLDYSGHAFAQPKTIKTLLDALEKSDKSVAGVGCANIPRKNNSFSARMIGLVFSTWLGGMMSTAQNLRLDKETYVDSIAFTL
ncbi:MAG: glycosyltransferase, partial [Nanoarchaeota archaeon]